MQPLSAFAGHNALCAQNRAEFLFVGQRAESGFQTLARESFARFNAPARKHFVGVVVMLVVMVMVTATAFAVVPVFVVVMSDRKSVV